MRRKRRNLIICLGLSIGSVVWLAVHKFDRILSLFYARKLITTTSWWMHREIDAHINFLLSTISILLWHTFHEFHLVSFFFALLFTYQHRTKHRCSEPAFILKLEQNDNKLWLTSSHSSPLCVTCDCVGCRRHHHRHMKMLIHLTFYAFKFIFAIFACDFVTQFPPTLYSIYMNNI